MKNERLNEKLNSIGSSRNELRSIERRKKSWRECDRRKKLS